MVEKVRVGGRTDTKNQGVTNRSCRVATRLPAPLGVGGYRISVWLGCHLSTWREWKRRPADATAHSTAGHLKQPMAVNRRKLTAVPKDHRVPQTFSLVQDSNAGCAKDPLIQESVIAGVYAFMFSSIPLFPLLMDLRVR